MAHKFITSLYDQFELEKREIDLVLCHALEINTAGLFIYRKEIDKKTQHHIIKMLKKRSEGVPLAYLTGVKEFWTLELEVNQHTLIPRPETELIIELLLKWTTESFTGKLLDLGTGTGAIALSFAMHRTQSKVSAVDYSQACVDTAQKNQQKYQLNNVNIKHSHWFSAITEKSFDYIVSNPPYIDEDDPHLTSLKHEPISALTAKNKGLADLFHIIEQSKHHLKNNGCIMLEHGYDQYEAVQKHLKEHGYLNIVSHKDLAGINRITTAQYKNTS